MPPAGLDVAGFAAPAVRDGDGLTFVGQDVAVAAGVAVPVDGQLGDRLDGFAFPLRGDLEVAHGGVDFAMVHQLAQAVNRDAGVGVPLGVGVPQPVHGDLRPAARHGIALVVEPCLVGSPVCAGRERTRSSSC